MCENKGSFAIKLIRFGYFWGPIVPKHKTKKKSGTGRKLNGTLVKKPTMGEQWHSNGNK